MRRIQSPSRKVKHFDKHKEDIEKLKKNWPARRYRQLWGAPRLSPDAIISPNLYRDFLIDCDALINSGNQAIDTQWASFTNSGPVQFFPDTGYLFAFQQTAVGQCRKIWGISMGAGIPGDDPFATNGQDNNASCWTKQQLYHAGICPTILQQVSAAPLTNKSITGFSLGAPINGDWTGTWVNRAGLAIYAVLDSSDPHWEILTAKGSNTNNQFAVQRLSGVPLPGPLLTFNLTLDFNPQAGVLSGYVDNILGGQISNSPFFPTVSLTQPLYGPAVFFQNEANAGTIDEVFYFLPQLWVQR